MGRRWLEGTKTTDLEQTYTAGCSYMLFTHEKSKPQGTTSDVDPDPVGSGTFSSIRFRIRSWIRNKSFRIHNTDVNYTKNLTKIKCLLNKILNLGITRYSLMFYRSLSPLEPAGYLVVNLWLSILRPHVVDHLTGTSGGFL